MIISRRLAVGAFASVGAVLVLAGTALACVPFKGTARVDSSNTGSVDSGTVTGNGSTTQQMRYCGNTASPGSTTMTAAENKGGDVITVTVGAATCPSGSDSKLDQGSHTVIVNNATVTADAPFSVTNTTKSIIQGKGCFTSPNPNGNKTLGSVSVDGNGDATGTFTLPTMNSVDGANNISALCVGQPAAGGNQGIFVPIKITATTGGGS